MTPLILALFEKRIEGDDSLLELARVRCHQAGLGAEMHASTPQELEHLMKFRPGADSPVVVHLPRHFNLADAGNQNQIMAMAARFAGRIHGLLLHDHAEFATDPDKFIRAARDLNSRLLALPKAPIVFVEYAAGLEPDVFARFFDSVRDLAHV